jgi:hypothetical protein
MVNPAMRTERLIFGFLVLSHLLPLFLLSYLVTHDGPTHVYNANLIRSLLFDSHPPASDFFDFNPQVIPNWISHILLMVFSISGSPAWAEKLVIGIYLVSFPYSFRAFLLSISKKTTLASYLIFPFVFAFSILTGLYSFCLGLSLSFYVLFKFQNYQDSPGIRRLLWLSFCMLVLYFSHLFVFVLTFCTLICQRLWDHLVFERGNRRSVSFYFSALWRKSFPVLKVSILPLLLSVQFMFAHSAKTGTEVAEFATMFQLFIDVRPVIAIDYSLESRYSQPLFYIYMLMLLSALLIRVLDVVKRKVSLVQREDVWLLLSVSMTMFYFILPDDIVSGGLVAIRFCLMAYLFLIIWLSVFTPRIVLYAGSGLSVLLTLILLIVRYEPLKSLSDRAAELELCATHIPEGKILATIDYSGNWMMDNITAYIAAKKNIILLDNYEANQVHFPLIWKTDRNPREILYSGTQCIDTDKFSSITGKNPDYILLIQKPEELTDSCGKIVSAVLDVHYVKLYNTPENLGILYKLKSE